MKHGLPILFLIFLLASAACNIPSGAPETDYSTVATYAAQTVAAQQGSIQPTPALQTEIPTQGGQTAQPTQPSAQATADGTSIPCNRARFVSDVSVPDNTNFTVGKSFTKAWKLQNTGSCAWTPGYSLVFDSGDQMSGPSSQPLTAATVAPGQSIDVSVNLVAPNAPGTYKGNWKLKDANGVVFALSTGPFWVQIKVAAAPDWPTFKKGASGMEVYAIQYLLLYHGETLAADGVYGKATRLAVESFQIKKNLEDDGVVGPETWQALIVTVAQGNSGNAVKAAQQLLNGKFGYNNVVVDGIFGPITAQAVKDFQTSKGLAADGVVGPSTWQKLVGE